jgi:hypothetical protein
MAASGVATVASVPASGSSAGGKHSETTSGGVLATTRQSQPSGHEVSSRQVAVHTAA